MVVLPIKLQHCNQTPWLRFDLFGVANALVTTWAGLKKEVLIGSFECSLSELLLLGEMTGRITANEGSITARVMGVVEGHREDHPGTLQKCYCLNSARSSCEGDLFVVETLWESLYSTIVPLQILPYIIADRKIKLETAIKHVHEFKGAAARQIEDQVLLHSTEPSQQKQMSLKSVCRADSKRHPLLTSGAYPDSDGHSKGVATRRAEPFHTALFARYASIAGALQTATEYDEKLHSLQERVTVRQAALQEVCGEVEWGS